MVNVDMAAWQLFIINVLYAALIMGSGWFGGNFCRNFLLQVMRTRKLDEAVVRFLATLVQYGVFTASVIAALERVGIASTSFVALLGSAGLAVGLALQGSLSHFASGVMILLYRPFDIGDVITAAGMTGQVTDIGLFATQLSTPDKQIIIIPNSAINSGTIINMTSSGIRRGGVSVGVAYGSDVQQVMQLLIQAASSVEQVHPDPGPTVTFDNLGASSLDFTVYCSCDTEHFGTMMSQVREAVYNHLNEANIDIPYSQLVVHNASALS